MNTVHVKRSAMTARDYALKARCLFQLAGAADDAETRRAICEQAAVNLAA